MNNEIIVPFIETHDRSGTFISPWGVAGNYSLLLCIDGTIEDTGLTIIILPKITISNIHPNGARPEESTVVSVSGMGTFDSSFDYTCLLNSSRFNVDLFMVMANVRNTSVIECNIPSAFQMFGNVVDLTHNRIVKIT
jgi:hypothetical protein